MPFNSPGAPGGQGAVGRVLCHVKKLPSKFLKLKFLHVQSLCSTNCQINYTVLNNIINTCTYSCTWKLKIFHTKIQYNLSCWTPLPGGYLFKGQ
jgi:hypothetical protein